MSWLQCHQQSLWSQYACFVVHLSKFLFIHCVLTHWAYFTFVCNVKHRPRYLSEWRNGFFCVESHNYNYFRINQKGSIVRTVTRMWAAPAGVQGIPGRKMRFFSSSNSQIAPGAHPGSCSMGNGALARGVKRHSLHDFMQGARKTSSIREKCFCKLRIGWLF
jgi:hypothetical protein